MPVFKNLPLYQSFSRIGNKISHRSIFFYHYMRNPRIVGAITPSSKALGKEVARQLANIHNDNPLCNDIPLIELGPGLGSFTYYLQKYNPTLIEINSYFCSHLAKKFPALHIHHGDAIAYLDNLQSPCGVVLSIPMISNPFSKKLLESINTQISKGNIRFMLTMSYNVKDPMKGVLFGQKKCGHWVLKNTPPARIWTYS